ncbi:putative toxin-antitoxin system antitoxin component (TIGR02293 family) [Pseudomonas helmanticensis]|uniref:Putative toxin-antitoxin system antitoxin component (TIGR02293 family) n=1 Tax=Pseudomonas helmanticensis TaxID=1471381 RepID=A0A4R7VEL0_9PSED|nr:antitoxin Xre/MbcA/ParS toxin-binding domain-containing protein [Pseudomonas helmanticensis]TDV47458.1 putative toxin-antitoxin system antitoxin component (TIGR02293 family) [Pseudomonas helmanticensis]
MKKDRHWSVQAQATHDGSGEVIVDLPAALLREMGLGIGDELAITVAGDTIILTPVRAKMLDAPRPTDVLCPQADDSYRNRMKVLLNIPVDATAQQIHEIIDAGVEATTLTAMSDLGLISPGTLNAILPTPTLKTKLATGERLTASQSDHLYRLAHTIALAESFFGDTDKAMRWLSKPKSRFSGKSPIEMLSTTVGSRQVEELLAQASEGMSF